MIALRTETLPATARDPEPDEDEDNGPWCTRDDSTWAEQCDYSADILHLIFPPQHWDLRGQLTAREVRDMATIELAGGYL